MMSPIGHAESYEDIMAWAGDATKVEHWLSRNKYARAAMGFGMGDWDVDAGKFSSTSRNLKKFRWAFGFRTAASDVFKGLTPEQQGSIADAVETTLTNMHARRDAEKKSEMLLGNIQAKSDMMEQLIETRRVKRDAEIAQTRGLY